MKKDMGGGALYDVGCYCIHAIRNIIGAEPTDIKATTKVDSTTGVDLTTTVQMELENGIQATFDCSFEMYGEQYYEVIGTKGKIAVPFAFRPDQHGDGIIKVEKWNEERIEKYAADIYVLEVEHFSQAILDDKQPSYTAENTIQNMRVIEACMKAIETGREVSLTK
jgi:predicted dehydrogenase